MTPETSLPADFERHLARLLVVLYHCGEPIASLIDGETRQVDSLAQLQRFDFWVREPGHLALALLHAYAAAPDRFARTLPLLHETLSRVMADDQGDIRRVTLPGARYAIFEDFDARLSFLTSRALVSDRPSFTRSRSVSHRVVLETPGTTFVRRIFESCPTFGWYRLQCEAVAVFYPLLDQYDLTIMTYLAPDLNLALAARSALLPIIRSRYAKTFGEPVHVDV